jgi:hypothetical protein
MSPITGLSPIGLQSQFRAGNANSSGNALGATNHPGPAATSPPDSATDNVNLSQFAELMSGLQLLAQTDPGQFQAILAEIGASISNAAEDAAGNSAAAGMVAQLESDFSDASTAAKPQPKTPLATD